MSDFINIPVLCTKETDETLRSLGLIDEDSEENIEWRWVGCANLPLLPFTPLQKVDLILKQRQGTAPQTCR